MQIGKFFFYFVTPYIVGWVLLWLSFPLVRTYRNMLLRYVKKKIAQDPALGHDDPDGNLVLRWHVFTVRYALSKDPATGQKQVRYLSIKERLSSTEKALVDLDRSFERLTTYIRRRFFINR